MERYKAFLLLLYTMKSSAEFTHEPFKNILCNLLRFNAPFLHAWSRASCTNFFGVTYGCINMPAANLSPPRFAATWCGALSESRRTYGYLKLLPAAERHDQPTFLQLVGRNRTNYPRKHPHLEMDDVVRIS
jgi:hypothetical protein